MEGAAVLLAGVGSTDLRAPTAKEFDEAVSLSNFPKTPVRVYVAWLSRLTSCCVQVERSELSSPTHSGEAYTAALDVVDTELRRHRTEVNLTFHLSAGTPAMAAVWIILAKTRFAAELIESSREHRVHTASVPFDISADFLPDLLRRPDEEFTRLSAGLPPEAPEFTQIVHRGRAINRLILRARRAPPRSVSVLIEGETGTGKELLSRAIHRASPRRDKPFIAVNCGAIPPELVESELFGHEKGAFTGATARRHGHFAAAHGGTLFLDEVGELPKAAQVKLLRALQEGEILPLGSSRTLPVDVRVIAATNRPLASEVAAGVFREDLFHRLAMAILRLPPLRERREDLPILIDHILSEVNREGHEGMPRRSFLQALEILCFVILGPETCTSSRAPLDARRSGRRRRPSRPRTSAMPCCPLRLHLRSEYSDGR